MSASEPSRKNYFQYLKTKWGIKSNMDIILILAVFSLAGMSITKINGMFMRAVGLTSDKPFAIRAAVYVMIFPFVYQCLLLIYGFLLGQWNFFWSREKKIGRFILKKVFRISSAE